MDIPEEAIRTRAYFISLRRKSALDPKWKDSYQNWLWAKAELEKEAKIKDYIHRGDNIYNDN